MIERFFADGKGANGSSDDASARQRLEFLLWDFLTAYTL